MELSYSVKNGWLNDITNEEDVFEFCEDYKAFLDEGKTERECAAYIKKVAIEQGYISIDEAIEKGINKAGTKIYSVTHKKTVALAVLGTNDIVNDGINMIGAHIDAPRIDLKPNPLYDDVGTALFKTHYYGGIKKYQWVTIPLALHGVFIKEDGTEVVVNIGEDDNDPVFTITDLLPHLAQDQMQKKLGNGITGEGLNLLIGSVPTPNDEKDDIKENILNILSKKYGIIEEDFISAELEIVPAFKAKDIGFDKSMVGAYGQDDRVCSHGAVRAILEVNSPATTSLAILTDKEEIGSMGNTGAESVILENFIIKLITLVKGNCDMLSIRECFTNSKMLSADVNPAVDSNYKDVQDLKNAAYLGKGIVIEKYTGSRGKVGGSDANAEFVAEIRKIFNDSGITWQTGELGKVDQGGGGTIAQYIANMGASVLDCGVPVLSMHSPFEVTSKIDIYMNYLANKAFLNN